MQGVLLVATGGALGSVGRYLVGLLMVRLLGANFPWGTLTVNIVGGFFIGLMFGLHENNRTVLLFATTGVLGGFTTFSAFSLETVRMMEAGNLTSAALYVIASVFFAGVGVVAGLALARAMQ